MAQIPHSKKSGRFITFSGLLICMILLPFLLLNLSIIIQTAIQPDQLPNAFGHKALILLPDSANGDRDVGIIRSIDPKELKPQDTIAYRQGQTFFIEKISQIKTDDGLMSIRTTAGPEQDAYLTTVPVSQIEGVLISRVPRLGGWALFMQTPVGLLLFMVLPVCLFLLHDAWHRKSSRAQQTATESI